MAASNADRGNEYGRYGERLKLSLSQPVGVARVRTSASASSYSRDVSVRPGPPRPNGDLGMGGAWPGLPENLWPRTRPSSSILCSSSTSRAAASLADLGCLPGGPPDLRT